MSRFCGVRVPLKLLIANDDGVSTGLKALADAASERGHDVFIATTSNHSSGASKSITFKARYAVTKLFDKYEALIVDSTPATAVGITLDAVRKDFDFIVSGVNSGPNLGLWDVLSSGTVGAVLEGVTRGLKGMAVSLVAREWSEYQRLSYSAYYTAARLAISILEVLAGRKWEAHLLNLNVPSWTLRGVRVAVLETAPQPEMYVCSGGFCDMSRWTLDSAYSCATPGSDVCVVKQGYAALTPIVYASTGPLEWLRKALEG